MIQKNTHERWRQQSVRQTTTKLSDLTRSQLNDMAITIGRIEGYFDKINSVKSVGAPMPKKE